MTFIHHFFDFSWPSAGLQDPPLPNGCIPSFQKKLLNFGLSATASRHNITAWILTNRKNIIMDVFRPCMTHGRGSKVLQMERTRNHHSQRMSVPLRERHFTCETNLFPYTAVTVLMGIDVLHKCARSPATSRRQRRRALLYRYTRVRRWPGALLRAEGVPCAREIPCPAGPEPWDHLHKLRPGGRWIISLHHSIYLLCEGVPNPNPKVYQILWCRILE